MPQKQLCKFRAYYLRIYFPFKAGILEIKYRTQLLPSLWVVKKKVLTATSQSHDEREKAITFCFACCFCHKETSVVLPPEKKTKKMGIENFLWPWQQFMLHLLRLKLSIFYFKTPRATRSRAATTSFAINLLHAAAAVVRAKNSTEQNNKVATSCGRFQT